MARKYNLIATPAEHAVKQRNFYHEVRAAIVALKADAVKASEPLNMTPLLRPTLDQGQIGDCAAFAWCAGKALCESMAMPVPAQLGFDYSQWFAYWVTRALMGTTGQDSGSNLGDVILSAEQTGTCLESVDPYVDGQLTVQPPQAAFDDASQHLFTGKAYPIDTSDPGNVTQALLDGCPVFFGFNVPPSFESCPATGVLPDPTGEESLGGHANLLYYDPACPQGFFPDQNSWGTGWGNGGRCQMPLSYVSRFLEAYALIHP